VIPTHTFEDELSEKMDSREPQDVPTINVPEAATFPVLEGKVAIVTGAAMGMGKATAIVSPILNHVKVLVLCQ
jgi:hypothetical protein